ncbi:hypothetical protein CBOM_06400 [Ceraceosorus bombacis]|uniref:Uncharacterized protein n=1 Tax=Ceraceosorus bombacis TaxID=401625 RepID=A0A0P1BJY9_9BASI|nr:hypothetical protein CBOM_06400 [Ceraceosorus bombacis]
MFSSCSSLLLAACQWMLFSSTISAAPIPSQASHIAASGALVRQGSSKLNIELLPRAGAEFEGLLRSLSRGSSSPSRTRSGLARVVDLRLSPSYVDPTKPKGWERTLSGKVIGESRLSPTYSHSAPQSPTEQARLRRSVSHKRLDQIKAMQSPVVPTKYLPASKQRAY